MVQAANGQAPSKTLHLKVAVEVAAAAAVSAPIPHSQALAQLRYHKDAAEAAHPHQGVALAGVAAQ